MEWLCRKIVAVSRCNAVSFVLLVETSVQQRSYALGGRETSAIVLIHVFPGHDRESGLRNSVLTRLTVVIASDVLVRHLNFFDEDVGKNVGRERLGCVFQLSRCPLRTTPCVWSSRNAVCIVLAEQVDQVLVVAVRYENHLDGLAKDWVTFVLQLNADYFVTFGFAFLRYRGDDHRCDFSVHDFVCLAGQRPRCPSCCGCRRNRTYALSLSSDRVP
nr:MAG TPA: hypothetical protein [Caudoviricetes sp.]